MGHKLNDISQNVERMNEYLFLNPDGTRSAHEQAPDLGNGVLNDDILLELTTYYKISKAKWKSFGLKQTGR